MAFKSKQGREFDYGRPIGDDLRMLIIRKIEQAGGDKQTMNIPHPKFDLWPRSMWWMWLIKPMLTPGRSTGLMSGWIQVKGQILGRPINVTR